MEKPGYLSAAFGLQITSRFATGLKFFMILVDISQIERMKSKSVSNMDLTDQSSQYFEYQMFIQGTVFGIYLVGLKAICDTVQRSLLTSEMF